VLVVSFVALAACVLVLTVDYQLFDTNYYTLWEATALLDGDHPYGDFYEWGVPLQAALSVVAQIVAGHRLIGEFVLAWLFIAASVAIAVRIALHLSQSVAATSATMVLAVVVLAATPIYHYPKLFLYTAAVPLAWWYMQRASMARAAVFGAATAVAFLFRHDHAVYIAALALCTFAAVHLVDRSHRSVRAFVRDGAVYAVAATLVVAPWAVMVQRGEGLPQYVRSRAEFFQNQSGKTFVWSALARMSPARAVRPDPESSSGLPTRSEAEAWLYQVTLLVPLLLLVSAARELRTRSGTDVTREVTIAAVFLLIMESRALREPSYFVVVAPITAALAARLVARRRPDTSAPRDATRRRWDAGSRLLFRAVVASMLLLTSIAALGYVRESELLRPREAVRRLRQARHALTAVPPIDGYLPRDQALRIDRATFSASDAGDKIPLMLRYVHDCTRTGDRILVTGSTPFQVGYYAERPVAGGHLFWHSGWRSDAVHEMESLALLKAHRVPFAVSTTDPVLQDFRQYPHIRDYLTAHYREVPESGGLLLIERHTTPTGRFGAVGFPCFR
jgi:hypothetical protein